MDKWIVHKFGGSSVADAGCFRRVAEIVEASPHPREAVVLSACRGVTDALLALVSLAEKPDGDFLPPSRRCAHATWNSLLPWFPRRRALRTPRNWSAIAATSPACCKPCASSAPRRTRCAT